MSLASEQVAKIVHCGDVLGVESATAQSSSAVVPQKGSEAFGNGQFTFQRELIDFSFDARANENGKSHGQAHFTFTSSSGQTEVTVRI